MAERVGLGQDSHRFLKTKTHKPCILGGIIFPEVPGFQANSDGDVIFHAICNAITSLTGVPVLGAIADTLVKTGITDSAVYLEESLKTLGKEKILHLALSIEASRPKIMLHHETIRASVAKTMKLRIEQIGLTATTGEQLTDFGRGEGLQCLAIITTQLLNDPSN